jgi:hypothetical protein
MNLYSDLSVNEFTKKDLQESRTFLFVHSGFAYGPKFGNKWTLRTMSETGTILPIP